MRFKTTMINDHGDYYYQTVYDNNSSKAKKNIQLSNPRSMIVDA